MVADSPEWACAVDTCFRQGGDRSEYQFCAACERPHCEDHMSQIKEVCECCATCAECGKPALLSCGAGCGTLLCADHVKYLPSRTDPETGYHETATETCRKCAGYQPPTEALVTVKILDDSAECPF